MSSVQHSDLLWLPRGAPLAFAELPLAPIALADDAGSLAKSLAARAP